jgi:adenylyltransferase/sulfurtransferase
VLTVFLKENQAGALVTFEGWVRDHNEGKKVSSLEYQVYEALAQKEGEMILEEARHQFNLHKIVCAHRHGHLQLGDIAVWVGAIASHRDDAFRASRYVIDQIKLRLPIWKKEHYEDQRHEWVYCRNHSTHIHFHEDDYYEKQAKLTHQDILRKARVLVVGAGGLGCPVLTSLAAAGVGHLDLADFDTISISNLHRQPLYSPEGVGEKKVTVATNKLSALNPFIRVHGQEIRIGPDNVEGAITGKDLVLDCTDNLETKFLLHDACFKLGIPLISASIYQFEGQVRTFIPGKKYGCLRCTYSQTPDDSKLGNCNDFGVLGSSVGVIGQIQANEALLFLMNGINTTASSTFYFNLKDLSQMKIRNFKKETCACCDGEFEIKEDLLEVDPAELNDSDFHLIDIRGKDDSYLESYRKVIDKKVVLYCYRGVRSKKLVKEQRALGFSHFYSLKGGACSL